ncbi:MAG: hypothetical protein ACR2FP_04975 [Nocardioidaceae bacterium]
MTTVPITPPLGVLGMDESTERAYRMVLRNPGCTLPQLCDRIGAPSEVVQADIDLLVNRRLVRAAGDAFVAEAPELALGRLLQQEARRLGELSEALAAAEGIVGTYVAEHRSGRRPGRWPVSVDPVPAAEFGDLLVALVTHSTGEMLALRPDQWFLPMGERMDAAVTEAISGGRLSRAIYPSRITEVSPESVHARVRAGEAVKLLPTVPTRMLVFGEEAAILPQRWGDTGGVRLLIRERSIVALCIAYYEQLWSRAVGASALRGTSGDEPHQALLEMLAGGAKDEQIARSLHMSLRTVRRRIAALLAELGADTRFQAGMEAVRRGWL